MTSLTFAKKFKCNCKGSSFPSAGDLQLIKTLLLFQPLQSLAQPVLSSPAVTGAKRLRHITEISGILLLLLPFTQACEGQNIQPLAYVSIPPVTQFV